ncbi:MAG: ATP-binding protein [Anaerosomatales bacterium]|nr:ATP-binding protein [Anaerosomatales bacterium]
MSAEPIVVACDAVALVGFTVASVAAALMPLPEVGARHARAIRGLLLGALGIYVFTACSNVLEHGGITAALDPYEDYIEILVFPLVAYALHEARVAGETALRERAERRLQEEHALLSTVMRVSPVGAMIVNPEGTIVFANETARELLALQETPDGTLEFETEPTCAPMRPGQAPALDLRKLGEGLTVRGVLCAVAIGARQLVLSVSSTPISAVASDGTSAPGTLVLVLDVTDRETALQELMDAQTRYAEALEYAVDARTADLLKANEELQAANEAKRRLLANVSHELRTPLNAVIGFADVLANGLAGPLAEEQAKQVAMIREAGRQLLELVEALLEAQWLESSEAIVEARPVDVADLVRSAVQMLDPLARTKGLALHAEIPETLEAVTDGRLIRQVLRNLISNAVKFTHEGGVTVRLLDAGDRFRIVVADTGVGIPKEALPRIFDAFVQVPGSRGEKPEGTGLGLAICKQIADALGGSIVVESEPGSGSTFTVELPKEPVSG